METEVAEEWGPAMSALDERARKFVVLRVWHGMNATQAAKNAGYSTKTDLYQRVQGCRLMQQDRIVAALKEVAEKRMQGATAIALVGLADAVESGKGRNRTAAQIEALDRFGFGKKSTQDIRVEHMDSRSTAQILADLQRLMPGRALPMLETTAEVVDVAAD